MSPSEPPRADGPAPDLPDVDLAEGPASLVALRDQSPVAEVSWRCSDDHREADVHIRARQHVGRSVAGALMDKALSQMASQGIEAVHLTLVPGQPETPELVETLRSLQRSCERQASERPAGVAEVHLWAAGATTLANLRLEPAHTTDSAQGESLPRQQPAGRTSAGEGPRL